MVRHFVVNIKWYNNYANTFVMFISCCFIYIYILDAEWHCTFQCILFFNEWWYVWILTKPKTNTAIVRSTHSSCVFVPGSKLMYISIKHVYPLVYNLFTFVVHLSNLHWYIVTLTDMYIFYSATSPNDSFDNFCSFYIYYEQLLATLNT
mgnify:CR=1 FL=1